MLHATTVRNHERQSLSRERGQALVEFALVLPLLLLVVLGIADFGRALGYKDDMTHLANAAARYAAVNNSPNGPHTLDTYITSTAPSGLQPLITHVLFTFPNNTTPNHCVGDPLTVTVQATYTWLRFLGIHNAVPGGLTSTMTSQSTMRLEKNYNNNATDAYTATHVLGACP
jgi:Flp pilus assembly protein TadG